MDIYDSVYFRINKNMLRVFGLWPYDSRKKIMRTFWLSLVFLLNVPHGIGLIVDLKNADKMMAHWVIFLVLIAVILKHFTLVIAEDKMLPVYEDIAKNWQIISDEEEKKILIHYSKSGRLLTIDYISLLSFTAVFFVSAPLTSMILDWIEPLEQPRPYSYLFQGEYLLENQDDYYWWIYSWDVITTVVLLAVCMAIDSMYMAIGEHGVALFAIVTHRLVMLRQRVSQDEHEDDSYEWLVQTIKLHQNVLSFTNNINESYSTCFLCLTIMNMAGLPASCVMMIICLDRDPLEFTRWILAFACLMTHVFVLFWPGQKFIDHSSKLLDDACCNEWYTTSPRTKKILRIFMLRCSQPSLITAGGLVVMNFETYLVVVKTAASYVTVLASFR